MTRRQFVELQEWFAGLDVEGRSHVEEAIRLGAEYSLFGLFAIVDGVQVIEQPNPEISIAVDGEPLVDGDDLHDIFGSFVHEHDERPWDPRAHS